MFTYLVLIYCHLCTQNVTTIGNIYTRADAKYQAKTFPKYQMQVQPDSVKIDSVWTRINWTEAERDSIRKAQIYKAYRSEQMQDSINRSR